jgi:SRSO17 transposase
MEKGNPRKDGIPRFFFLRVRRLNRDELRRGTSGSRISAQWPRGEAENDYASWYTARAIGQLIRLAKLRWRIERDYQELKGSVGWEHYESRGWRGFHHHRTLRIAGTAFLAAERMSQNQGEPPVRPEPQGTNFD